MDDEIDLDQMEADADAKTAEPNAALEEAVGLALEIEEKIYDLTARLKVHKKSLDQMMTITLPQLMQEAGVPEFGTEGGARIKLGPSGYGSLGYAPDEEAAVAYLDSKGFTNALKSTVTVDFTESEREDADKLLETLREHFEKFGSLKRNIHAGTLKAFCLEQMAEDPTFDPSILGITIISQAKFTKRPKI